MEIFKQEGGYGSNPVPALIVFRLIQPVTGSTREQTYDNNTYPYQISRWSGQTGCAWLELHLIHHRHCKRPLGAAPGQPSPVGDFYAMSKPLLSQRSPDLEKLFNSHLWKAAQHKHRGPSRHKIQKGRVQHVGWPQHQLESSKHISVSVGFKPV
jgi:hypothetical protein